MSKTTVSDCHLNGVVIDLLAWPRISSGQLAEIVGQQEPGGALEDASKYDWKFILIPVGELTFSNEDYEEPEGGWSAAHVRNMTSDAQAISAGSTEYSGRDEWIREEWCKNTSIYPLFVVREEGEYRLWDGYRRLAGAFYYGIEHVAVLLGAPH